MSRGLNTLFAEGRGARLLRLATVASISAPLVWFGDALVDAVVLRGGHLVDHLIRPSRVEIWVRILVLALVLALNEARRANARLHLMASAVEVAPDGVQLADLQGRISYSNRAIQTIYGFSPAELRGKHVNEMNADPGFASRVILPELARSGGWEGELLVKHKDGRTFPVWLRTSIIPGRGGDPVAAVGIIRDISQRKRAEEDLRGYAERLEQATHLKDLFADILRHDLLGPTSGMRVTLDALQKQAHGPSTAKLLGLAQRSCKRLTELMEGAARYARLSALEEVEFEALDLGAILRRVVSDFEPERAERSAVVELAARGEYRARANPMIGEVFSNLLSNALKYGPEGGTIAIDVGDAGDRWDVSVADAGEGIPDADKERVFTRFERLRKEGVKGSGLGLAIAKRLVDLHGGRIWVVDNPGGGSVFHVELPKA